MNLLLKSGLALAFLSVIAFADSTPALRSTTSSAVSAGPMTNNQIIDLLERAIDDSRLEVAILRMGSEALPALLEVVAPDFSRKTTANTFRMVRKAYSLIARIARGDNGLSERSVETVYVALALELTKSDPARSSCRQSALRVIETLVATGLLSPRLQKEAAVLMADLISLEPTSGLAFDAAAVLGKLGVAVPVILERLKQAHARWEGVREQVVWDAEKGEWSQDTQTDRGAEGRAAMQELLWLHALQNAEPEDSARPILENISLDALQGAREMAARLLAKLPCPVKFMYRSKAITAD